MKMMKTEMMMTTSLRIWTGATRSLKSLDRGNTALSCTPQVQATSSQLPTRPPTLPHTSHPLPTTLLPLSSVVLMSDSEPRNQPPPTPSPPKPTLRSHQLLPHPSQGTTLPLEPLQHSLTPNHHQPCLLRNKGNSQHLQELPNVPTPTHPNQHTPEGSFYLALYQPHLNNPDQDPTCSRDHHQEHTQPHQPHHLPCSGGAGMTSVVEPTP